MIQVCAHHSRRLFADHSCITPLTVSSHRTLSIIKPYPPFSLCMYVLIQYWDHRCVHEQYVWLDYTKNNNIAVFWRFSKHSLIVSLRWSSCIYCNYSLLATLTGLICQPLIPHHRCSDLVWNLALWMAVTELRSLSRTMLMDMIGVLKMSVFKKIIPL